MLLQLISIKPIVQARSFRLFVFTRFAFCYSFSATRIIRCRFVRVVAFVGFDDELYEAVAHYVFVVEIDETDTFDIG